MINNDSEGRTEKESMANKLDRIGETMPQKCGMSAKILGFRSRKDCDVVFDNGYRKNNVSYENFVRGLLYPGENYYAARTDAMRNERLYQHRLMVCGQECEIIAYRSSADIDVRFVEDGQVVSNRSYSDFLAGAIKNPNIKCDMKKRAERLNTQRQMASGLWAIVCEYRRADDIDVKFEIDGAVSKSKRWKDFLNGKIAHPDVAPNYDHKLHVGEIKEMRNGLQCRVVAYRKSTDIDVRFVEDNALVVGTDYALFAAGKIAHPTIKTIFDTSLQEFAIQYYLTPLGFRKIEKGEWKNRGFGRYELDLYNDMLHVAIECDGSIHNKDGGMERDVDKNQKCKELGIVLYRLRDPYLKPMDDGLSINYVLDKNKRVKNNLLIDCKSELEEILKNHNISVDPDYIDFERDADDIFEEYKNRYINNRGSKHVGEISFCKSVNQKIVLVSYHNTRKVDIEFEDGQRVNGITMSAFRKGQVLHPAMTRSDLARQIANRENSLISRVKRKSEEQATQRLHEKSMTNDGCEIEIIKYNSSEDVIVAFSDGSTTKTNYANFKNGAVRHPSISNDALATQRLHERSITKEGYEIEIIRYGNNHDIDILFVADNWVRTNLSYCHFLIGDIKHPSKLPENRLNKVFTNQQGYDVKVIAYRSANDIDIEFLIDGTVKSGVRYVSVERGLIKHPTRDSLAEQRINQTTITNEGHEIKMVAYRSSTDIDVLFVKDSVYRYNVRYSEFKNGTIAHPNTMRNRKKKE